MNAAVVVHCHPLTASFTAAVRDRAIAGLRRADIDVREVVELGESPKKPPPRLDVATLVLVYPTWWSGQPAVLAEWLHDALPLLTTVHRLIAISSHGSPKRINLLEGENGKRILRKVVLGHCAPRATFEWIAFYNIDAAAAEKRTAFLDRVETQLARRR